MKKEILFQKLLEGIETQDYLILQQFCEIAENEYPDENETIQAGIVFAQLNWNKAKVIELTALLVAKNPKNANFKLDLAAAYFQNYQNAEALTLLEAIIAENSADELVLARYAKLIVAHLSDEESLNKAVLVLNQIIKKYPQAAEPLLDRALAYQNMSLYPQATKDLKRALQLTPDNEEIVQKLIAVCQYQDQPQEVENYYQMLLDLSPDNSNYLTAYGDFLATQTHFQQAAAAYTQAIDLELAAGNDAVFNRRARGELYLKTKEYKLAIADFTAALANFDDSAIRLNRARAYQGLANEKAFLAELKAVTNQKDFHYADALLLRVDFFIDNKNWDKAEKDAKIILADAELSFHLKDAFLAMGKIAQGRNDLKKAAEYWRKAADLYQPEAQKLIDTYCGTEIAAVAEARKQKLAHKFAPDVANNQSSPILSALFGKIWVLDADKTMNNNPSISEMPAALIGFFMEAFKQVNVQISPQTININNPNADSLEAFYRVSQENSESVRIYGQPTNDKETRELVFGLIDGSLKISGLLSAAEADAPSLDLYFQIGSPENIQPLDEKAQAEQMKNLAENFLSGLLQTVVEGIENANTPDGEAASDAAPSDLQHD